MTFSERLRFVLKTFKISQTELARRIQVKPQIIQYLCASNSHKSKFVFDIAEALQVDVMWLMTGKGHKPRDAEMTESHRSIPLLTFTEIKEYKVYGKEEQLATIQNWLPISDDLNLRCYAVMLNDPSMAPRFDLEAIIIVDPDVQIKNDRNLYVLAYIKEADFVVFRALEISGKKQTLKPINQKLYKNLDLTSEDKILGVCKEVRWNY